MEDATQGEPTRQFDLNEARPQILREFACGPKNLVRVVLINGDYMDMAGILNILKGWPNLQVSTIRLPADTYPKFDCRLHDIVLLDEKLPGKITGSDIVEHSNLNGFTGVLASVAPGDICPLAFRGRHFGHKALVAESYEAAYKFVCWMNYLIKEVEGNRMD